MLDSVEMCHEKALLAQIGRIFYICPQYLFSVDRRELQLMESRERWGLSAPVNRAETLCGSVWKTTTLQHLTVSTRQKHSAVLILGMENVRNFWFAIVPLTILLVLLRIFSIQTFLLKGFYMVFLITKHKTYNRHFGGCIIATLNKQFGNIFHLF